MEKNDKSSLVHLVVFINILSKKNFEIFIIYYTPMMANGGQMKGWIKMHRCIKESRYGKNVEMLGFWMHLLLKANHKDNYNSNGILVKSGQMTTGRKAIALETGLSESKVERFLKKLEIEQQIEQQKTSKYRIISIVNWHKYQSTEQHIEQQANNKRTTSEQQVNTNKNVKNEKNGKNTTESEKIDEMQIIQMWNDFFMGSVKMYTGSLGNDARNNFVEAIGFMPEKESWLKIFEKIKSSKSMMANKSFNLLFVLKYDNSMKILNGTYDWKDDVAESKTEFISYDKIYQCICDGYGNISININQHESNFISENGGLNSLNLIQTFDLKNMVKSANNILNKSGGEK